MSSSESSSPSPSPTPPAKSPTEDLAPKTPDSTKSAPSTPNRPTFKPKTPKPPAEKDAEDNLPKEPVKPFFLQNNKVRETKFETAFPSIPAIMLGMKNYKGPSGETLLCVNVMDGWRFFNKYTSSSTYGVDIASLWNQKLADSDYLGSLPCSSFGLGSSFELYTKTWELFFGDTEAGYLERVLKAGHTDKAAAQAFDCFYQATSVLWNTTDSCTKMCELTWKYKVIEKILDQLKAEQLFSPEKFQPNSEAQKNRLYHFIMSIAKALISVIMNALRRTDESAKFRELGGVELMMKYRDTSDPVLNVISSCCIAYGANEEQLKNCPNLTKIVTFLYNGVVSVAVNRSNRRYRGFSIEETMEAMNSMATQDEVQEILIQPRPLQLFHKILKTYKEEAELQQVTNLFWTLSFNESNREKIRETLPTFSKDMQSLADHKILKVRKAVQGCLWNMDGVRPKSAGKSRRQKGGGQNGDGAAADEDLEVCPIPMPMVKRSGGGLESYIMVSYDWGKKEIVLLLNQALKAHGFQTWIDVEQMSGSTLDAMADAVEKASIVLICVSDRYKESPNCRAEAEYAFRLNKPIVPCRMQPKFKPEGWLGILMGTKFYFDCTHKRQIAEAAERVTHEIRKSYVTDYLGAESATRLSSAKSMPDIAQPNPVPKPDRLKSWDREKVHKWLQEHDLGHLTKKMTRFDGKLVNQLSVLYTQKPSMFMQLMDRLKIDHPEDIIRLTNAIEEHSSTGGLD